MIKKNTDIRKAAKESGVFLWEIADKLGVSEPTVNRYLRKEMSDSLKGKILCGNRAGKARTSGRNSERLKAAHGRISD